MKTLSSTVITYSMVTVIILLECSVKEVCVLTMMFALLAVSMQQRVKLKFALVVSGEQYVVVDGMRLVPEWFADSWDMNGQVRNNC